MDGVRVATKGSYGKRRLTNGRDILLKKDSENRSPDAARAIAATSVHERLIFIRGVARAKLLLLLPRRPPLGTPPPRWRFSLHLLLRHRCRRRSRLTAARPRTWLPNFVERERTSTWTPWRISCPRRSSARRDEYGAIVLNPQGSPGRICTGLARRIVLGAPSGARDPRFHGAMFRCGGSPLLSRTGRYNPCALWSRWSAPRRGIVGQRGHLFGDIGFARGFPFILPDLFLVSRLSPSTTISITRATRSLDNGTSWSSRSQLSSQGKLTSADFYVCMYVCAYVYACTYKTGSGTHPPSAHGFVPLVELPAYARSIGSG